MTMLLTLFFCEILLNFFDLPPKKSPLRSFQGAFVKYHHLCDLDSFQDLVEGGYIQGEAGKFYSNKFTGYSDTSQEDVLKKAHHFFKRYKDYHRVFVLGDSFAYGWRADPGKGVVDLLHATGAAHQVAYYNSSIPGFGQNNQLRALEAYYNIINPKSVLLFFFLNDFEDNLVPVDRNLKFPGEIIINRYEIIKAPEGVSVRRMDLDEVFDSYKAMLHCPLQKRHFSLKDYIREVFFKKTRIGMMTYLFLHRMKINFFQKDTEAIDMPDNKIYGVGKTKKYLSAIKEFCDRHGMTLHVILIPDLLPQDQGVIKSEVYLKAVEIFDEIEQEVLEPIHFLQKEDYYGENDWNYFDNHWNNQGHAKVAEFLREKLWNSLESKKLDREKQK